MGPDYHGDGRRRSNPIRRVLVCLLAVLAIAGWLTLLLLPQAKAPASITLSDGTRIQLLGTTVGFAAFNTDKPWQRLVRRLLPARLSTWLPPPSSWSCGGASNSVNVFLRVTAASPATANLKPWKAYASEDDAGFRYSSGGDAYSSFGNTGLSLCYGITLPAFPRRQPQFLLHLLDSAHQPVATFTVRNPITGPFPTWATTPMPQTRTNGPVSLTLTSLERSGPDGAPVIQPKWELSATQAAWLQARPRLLSFADATGNEASRLSPREPAWKVNALVYRERPEDFGPEEKFTISDVSVPDANALIAIDRAGVCAGVRLKVLLFAPPGEVFITNGTASAFKPRTPGAAGTYMGSSSTSAQTVESWGSDRPFLLWEAAGLQGADEVQCRVLDDQGRNLDVDSASGYMMRAANRVYALRFFAPEDAQRLTLEFRVSRPLRFEFLVNPADTRVAAKPGS